MAVSRTAGYLYTPALSTRGLTITWWMAFPAVADHFYLGQGHASTYGHGMRTRAIETNFQFALFDAPTSLANMGCFILRPLIWYGMGLVCTASGGLTGYITSGPRLECLSETTPIAGTTSETQPICLFSTGSGDYGGDAYACRLRVHQAELTVAQILTELGSATASRMADLYCDCPLTTNIDLADISGNGNNLTSAAATLATVSGPTIDRTIWHPPAFTANLHWSDVGDSRDGTDLDGVTSALQTLRPSDTCVHNSVIGTDWDAAFTRTRDVVIPSLVGITDTCLMGCMPVCVNDANNGRTANECVGWARSYAAMVRELGGVYGVPVICCELSATPAYNVVLQAFSAAMKAEINPPFLIIDTGGHPNLMNPLSADFLGDGVHLSTMGYADLASALDAWATLAKLPIVGQGGPGARSPICLG
jgi:hypothetical protein